MTRVCTVEVNGERFSAYCGDLLLDAALMSGVDIPHDCRSGRCGTCRVRIVSGRCFGGSDGDPDYVHACQGRIVSDLKVTVEDMPEIVSVPGRVAALVPRAPDVVEVCIALAHPIGYLPGQYCSVQFRGFPPRCYSPTSALEWPCDPGLLRFHVRLLPGGRVSSALGREIAQGHRVKITGPFGSAFLRSHPSHRLVLVAGGTGFAPIWSIAEAAITELPRRELVLVAGARTLASLYMIPALCRLALFPHVAIIPVVSSRQSVSEVVRLGHPADYLPPLSRRDVVYCAGSPAMVESIIGLASAAGARCYSDPFEPAPEQREDVGLLARAADWLSSARHASPPLSMADWVAPDVSAPPIAPSEGSRRVRAEVPRPATMEWSNRRDPRGGASDLPPWRLHQRERRV